MKQVDSIAEEHRDQFNAPIIVFRCPSCNRMLASLSANNSEHSLEQGIPALEMRDMMAEGMQRRNVLALQVDPRFVWSYKENKYVSPVGYDGKRYLTKHDKTEIQGILKEMRRILDFSLCLEHRRPQLEESINQQEELLQNLNNVTEEGTEIIYESALLKYPNKMFDCCSQTLIIRVLEHADFIVTETDANPRI